jgi:hypothetical protein
MSYRWRYVDEEGMELPGPEEEFEDQLEAESWLGEYFADLRDSGIDAVTLLHDEVEVYGPMSLYE